jgi:hypothetical protein
VSEAQRIEPFEIVQSSTGERIIPPYMETDSYLQYVGPDQPPKTVMGYKAVLSEGLKKDGTPSFSNHRGRIFITPYRTHYGDWFRYDPEKEDTATVIREIIANLEQQLVAAKQELLDLYKS